MRSQGWLGIMILLLLKLQMSGSNKSWQKSRVVITIEKIMLASIEATVNYVTPLGLHHIMATSHHYGLVPYEKPIIYWNPIRV